MLGACVAAASNRFGAERRIIVVNRIPQQQRARRTLAALAALLSICAVEAMITSPACAQTMALPGKLEVNAGGASAYTIPIAVPPGTAGMHPALTIEYTSQGQNGIVGVGAALGGLPSVTRCPQTMDQDGARGSVNFDGNDR